MQMQNKLWS